MGGRRRTSRLIGPVVPAPFDTLGNQTTTAAWFEVPPAWARSQVIHTPRPGDATDPSGAQAQPRARAADLLDGQERLGARSFIPDNRIDERLGSTTRRGVTHRSGLERGHLRINAPIGAMWALMTLR